MPLYNLDTGGRELGYTETTNLTYTVVTPVADVTGLSVAVTAGSRPFMLEAEITAQIGIGTGAAGGDSQIQLQLVDEAAAIVQTMVWKTKVPSAGSVQQAMSLRRRLSYAVGTAKTFKLRANAVLLPTNTQQFLLAGTGAAGNAFGAAFIRAVEL